VTYLDLNSTDFILKLTYFKLLKAAARNMIIVNYIIGIIGRFVFDFYVNI